MATWKDITIEKYEAISKLQEKNLSELDLIAGVISIIDGISLKEVEDMPYATLLLKARGLRFLQSTPIARLVQRSYTLKGNKFIPTLNPADLTTAQYIDFQVRSADAPNDIAGLLSVLLIPEGHKYNDGYSQDEVREAIYRHMGIEDALGLSAFFFTLWKKSIRTLLRENRKALRQLKRKKNLTENEKALIQTTQNLIRAIEAVRKYY